MFSKIKNSLKSSLFQSLNTILINILAIVKFLLFLFKSFLINFPRFNSFYISIKFSLEFFLFNTKSVILLICNLTFGIFYFIKNTKYIFLDLI